MALHPRKSLARDIEKVLEKDFANDKKEDVKISQEDIAILNCMEQLVLHSMVFITLESLEICEQCLIVWSSIKRLR